MKELTKEELEIIKKLNTPSKIQTFLNALKINYEEGEDTCYSPRKVLQEKSAHCIEGAILAAMILRYHGHEPLIVDMTATPKDWDHVIAVFKKNDKWGAISKTNHVVLRYREPVYDSIRELIMSFFHEYTDDFGNKTLRSYSNPVNLKKFDRLNWMSTFDHLWEIAEHLVTVKHYPVLTRSQIQGLRKLDDLEIQAGTLLEHPKDNLVNQIDI